MVVLAKNFKGLFLEKGKIGANPKKEVKILIALEIIKDFIYKLNYYLENKKITMENLKVDFSTIFGVNDKDTAQGLYDLLKKYDNRYKSQGIKYFMDAFSGEEKTKFENNIDTLRSIDTFFLKIAKYQENKYLISSW